MQNTSSNSILTEGSTIYLFYFIFNGKRLIQNVSPPPQQGLKHCGPACTEVKVRVRARLVFLMILKGAIVNCLNTNNLENM